jgi:hypothetical protein
MGSFDQFLRITSRPFHLQFLPLHRCARRGGELEVALLAVDFEQERRPSVHAATDLKDTAAPSPTIPLTTTWSGTVLAISSESAAQCRYT